MEGTGVSVNPIFYSAGYKEEGGEQSKPYNLTKLLSYIIKATPKEKRIVYVNNINRDAEMWEHDDDLADYSESIHQSFAETWKDEVSKGSKFWGDVGGAIAGDFGRTIGCHRRCWRSSLRSFQRYWSCFKRWWLLYHNCYL